jgi:hypothetical protein
LPAAGVTSAEGDQAQFELTLSQAEGNPTALRKRP